MQMQTVYQRNIPIVARSRQNSRVTIDQHRTKLSNNGAHLGHYEGLFCIYAWLYLRTDTFYF